MQTLLCPHWAPCHAGQDDDRFMRELKPKIVKLFWSGDSIPRLDVALGAATDFVILREHGISENWDQRGIRDRQHALDMAAIHASAWWALIPDGVPRERLAVEGLNEPRVMEWGSEQPELTSAYYAELMRLMTVGGIRVVAGNLSVGWPGNNEPVMPPDSPPIWRGFVEMIDAVNEYAGFLAVHEYCYTNGPREPYVFNDRIFGGWGWWMGRFKVCPWDVPIIITECGIDAHLLNKDYYGWHGLPEPRVPTYFKYLVDYEMQCILDGRVIGITPFTHDFYDPKWATYDTRPKAFTELWVAHARDMEAGNYTLPAPWSLPAWSSEPWAPDGVPQPPQPPQPPVPPVPIPAPVSGPDVIDLAHEHHDLAWLTENYGVTIDTSLVKATGRNLRIVLLEAVETLGHTHDNVRGYHSVNLIGEAGEALANWAIGRTWPDAPNHWSNGVAPDNVTCPPEAKAAAIFGTTNLNGAVSWVAGPDDVAHNKDGANVFWCPSHEFGGDVMRGGGLFGDPSGKMIVWVPTFQLLDGDVPPIQPPPEPPEPTPPGGLWIRVQVGEVILREPLEEYLINVVPAEIPASSDPAALRVQAVPARTYAMWRLKNPREVTFDIYGDARDQVYDPSYVNPVAGDTNDKKAFKARMKLRVMEAISDTAGIHLVDENGNVPKSMYKAECGRDDCPNCQGEPGTLDKCWPGQACQNGIMALAVDGVPWRMLAVFYYTGWRLSDDVPVPPFPSIPDIRWNIEEAVREGEAATVLQDAARARLLSVIQQLYEIERG